MIVVSMGFSAIRSRTIASKRRPFPRPGSCRKSWATRGCRSSWPPRFGAVWPWPQRARRRSPTAAQRLHWHCRGSVMDLVTLLTGCALGIRAELFVPLGALDGCSASFSVGTAVAPQNRSPRMGPLYLRGSPAVQHTCFFCRSYPLSLEHRQSARRSDRARRWRSRRDARHLSRLRQSRQARASGRFWSYGAPSSGNALCPLQLRFVPTADLCRRLA